MNEKTLVSIDENLRVEGVVGSCRKAWEAGLELRLRVMVGYPWESREEAFNTLKLAKKFLERGWAVTLQATVVIPYSGTSSLR